MQLSHRLQGQTDNNPQPEVIDSIKGVDFDYSYTGRHQGTSKVIIEIHISSTVTDWAQNVYTRKSWYMGHKKDWKECIQEHIRTHLLDLSIEKLIVTRMMREFEVTKEKFEEWEKYQPSHFRGRFTHMVKPLLMISGKVDDQLLVCRYGLFHSLKSKFPVGIS